MVNRLWKQQILNSGKLPILIFIATGPIFGLGLALLGSYFYSFFDKDELSRSIIIHFLIVFLGVIIGIALPGYFYSSQVKRKNNFFNAVGCSIIGLVLFFVLYLIQTIFTSPFLPYYFNAKLLPIFTPLIGAILGFLYGLKNK